MHNSVAEDAFQEDENGRQIQFDAVPGPVMCFDCQRVVAETQTEVRFVECDVDYWDLEGVSYAMRK
jgi:hypothetical protein